MASSKVKSSTLNRYNYETAKYENFVPTAAKPIPLHKQLAGDPPVPALRDKPVSIYERAANVSKMRDIERAEQCPAEGLPLLRQLRW